MIANEYNNLGKGCFINILMITIISSRQYCVLDKLINEYLAKGKAVSSSCLDKKYKLGISPATIRNDFKRLTEEGYLYKPHASSGRIPTDKAWQFLISEIFQEDVTSSQKKETLKTWLLRHKRILKEREQLKTKTKELLDRLIQENHSFYFCYLLKEEELIEEGLRYMFQGIDEEDFLSLDFIRPVLESLDKLEEKLKDIKITRIPSVFVGEENPFIDSDQFSALITSLPSFPAVLGILGPKRMPYRENIMLLKNLNNIFS